MQPRIKFGLIVGVIGLVLNICVATAVGICGPFTGLLAGAVAGFLAATNEKRATKADGARTGVIAGLVAGGLVFIGQLIGAGGAVALVQSTGGRTILGQAPDILQGGAQGAGYLVGVLATGMCFGAIGVGLAAGAGALAGYLVTKEEQMIMPPPPPPVTPGY
jgi:hypothetical protein